MHTLNEGNVDLEVLNLTLEVEEYIPPNEDNEEDVEGDDGRSSGSDDGYNLNYDDVKVIGVLGSGRKQNPLKRKCPSKNTRHCYNCKTFVIS